MDESKINVQKMPEKSKKIDKKENPEKIEKQTALPHLEKETPKGFNTKVHAHMKQIVSEGMYAVDMPDEIPPLEHMKFLDERGNFTDQKPNTIEDVAYYWRSKQKQLAIVMGFSGIGLILILLSATNVYATASYDFVAGLFSQLISFLFGLLPFVGDFL